MVMWDDYWLEWKECLHGYEEIEDGEMVGFMCSGIGIDEVLECLDGPWSVSEEGLSNASEGISDGYGESGWLKEQFMLADMFDEFGVELVSEWNVVVQMLCE